MLLYNKRIVVTGGSGRFGKILKKNEKNFKFVFFFPNKKKFNILKYKSLKTYLKKIKPKYLIHLAGLSRPMSIHDKDFRIV